MANPIWLTGQGKRTVDLGTVTEGSYFEYPIDREKPNQIVKSLFQKVLIVKSFITLRWEVARAGRLLF